jgi:serine/threonine protein phosphatase PrpC
MLKTLIGCASDTIKSSQNQDYCVTVENSICGISGVILADGIGSHFKSEYSAKFCSEYLKKQIEALSNINYLDFDQLFSNVQAALIIEAKKNTEFDFNSLDKENSLGTTLICVIDCDNFYNIAYVGNGSIWYISGGFTQFNSNFYLPWNSINLLNPHCVEQEGKSALERFISISDSNHTPTILKISKNTIQPGEIIVATTDGVSSNDAVQVGKDGEGTLWIKAEETLPILYDYLSKFMGNNIIQAHSTDLNLKLQSYLAELKTRGLMHDDTTLGVIVSQKAIEYHDKMNHNTMQSNIAE